MPFFNLPSSGSGSAAILSGSGAPSSSLGSNGGFYLDTANKKLYGPKTAGAWGSGIALSVADWAEITSKPTTFAPSAHTHSVSDVTGLQAALDGKQAAGNYATLVSGVVPSSQLPSYVDDVLEYATLPATGETGKIYVNTTNGKIYRWSGSAFIEVIASPGTTDAITEGSTNLFFTAARAVSALSTSLAGKANVSHTHAIADVTGLQTALDGKQATGSYAAATHTHAISDVTGLQTALDGKAALSHTHTIANVTGLQAALDGKQASGSYAAASHTHAIADVTGLQTALDGKQAAGTYATLVSSLVPTANLPKATTSTIGAVSVGSGLSVSDGVLSANGYTLTAATASSLGGVKIGSNVSVSADGTISVAAPYTLPAPTATTIGGVKAGTNITIETDGTISAASGGGSYTLPVATVSVLGGVKTGSNVTIAADGTISVAAPTTDASALTSGTLAAARLPVATGSAVGGVIVGTGLSIASSILSAAVQSVNSKTGAVSLSASDVGAPASNTTGITGAAAISNIVSLTAAQYAALGTKNSSTLYIVAG
jgi:Phage tail repeat like